MQIRHHIFCSSTFHTRMARFLLVVVVIAITTSNVYSNEYNMEKVLGDAKKEIMEDLQRLTINGASSRKFARKKFTEL